MAKLLVTDPQEIQMIIEAIAYYDPTRIDWDEREHGTMPAISELGGLERYIDQVPVLDPLGVQIIDDVVVRDEDGEIVYTLTPLTDGEGLPVLDSEGNPMFIPETVDVPRTRSVNKLRVNTAKKALHDDALQAITDAEEAEAAIDSDLDSRKATIRAALASWETVTQAQLKQAVRYLLKKDLRE